jgi:hypothetical protein
LELVSVQRSATLPLGIATVAMTGVKVATEVGHEELLADQGIVDVYHNVGLMKIEAMR